MKRTLLEFPMKLLKEIRKMEGFVIWGCQITFRQYWDGMVSFLSSPLSMKD